ncbi:prothymosin alpha-like [Piliocolobus tephrosceles]|uniref:prothymosin alpha-like n=1 Tax=Piliocolobus tephrosceles TaxID=591936 RepID=UPI000E6B27F4|nr:prothymosin alpha-like [Piliocolobus tephrosceles]
MILRPPTPLSTAAVDTGSEITTTDLQEKEVAEQAENGRDAAAIGNANEENGEQETDNEVDEQEEEGGEEEEEEEEGDAEEEDGDEDGEAESATGKRAAEDNEDDDVDTKKQKIHGDDQTAEKEKLNLPANTGRICTKILKKVAWVIIEKYYIYLGSDWYMSKYVCKEITITSSKELCSKIASYETHLMKEIRGPDSQVSPSSCTRRRRRRREK